MDTSARIRELNDIRRAIINDEAISRRHPAVNARFKKHRPGKAVNKFVGKLRYPRPKVNPFIAKLRYRRKRK
jgi:hypothetical protein